jgi:hypothetical protein
LSLEELTPQLWEASEHKQGSHTTISREPLPNTACPYEVCTASKNQIVLVCWQTGDFTKAGGKEGCRNLKLDRIESIEALDWHFQKRTDFNSTDGQYKNWVYHI